MVISEEDIYKALQKIKPISNCVRIYSVTRGLEKVPEIAEKLNMEVIAGAWLSKLSKKEEAVIEEEINNLIKIGREQKNIRYLVVGNETLHFKTLNLSQLLEYLDRIYTGIYGTADRNKIVELQKTEAYKDFPPITTTELREVWKHQPYLMTMVDVVGLHSLPYWDKQPIDEAVNFIVNDIGEMNLLTEKPIVLLETGWPTNGPRSGKAVSGLLNQRKFVDMADARLAQKGIFFNISDAFDVPDKISSTEGLVGPHWGIFDAKGNQKRIYSMKDIYTGMGAYVFLMAIMFWYVSGFFRYPFIENDPTYKREHDILLEKNVTYSFILIAILAGLFAYLVMIFSRLVGGNLIYLQILSGIVSFYVFFELCQKIMHHRISRHASVYLAGAFPRLSEHARQGKDNALVSIHIAAKDEEPEQVIRTITRALMQSHKHIEVIYVDNNSSDDSSFKKVKNYFEGRGISLTITFGEGKSLKLFYEKHIAGFKAGALNYALEKTDPRAEYIALLDSDYETLPHWIETGLWYAKENVGFIQFPQAYREEKEENVIMKGARLEQDYVFKVVYPMRAFLGGIVMNGTMVIINRKAMRKNGWPMWSICEDGALGAEIISAGFRSAYVPINSGYGKSPDTFFSLRKQRNRWIFGSMQVLKKYAFDKKHKWNNTLALYLSDWFGWIMHGLYPVIMLFTIAFILSAWIIYVNILFDWTFFLGLAFVSASLLLFILNFEKYIHLQSPAPTGMRLLWYVKSFIKNVSTLILLELSVVNTICRSVLQSLFKNKMNFNVTRSVRVKKKIRILFPLTVLGLIIFALLCIYFMYDIVHSMMFLLPLAQIFIVFLPQAVYILYKLKY